MGDFRTNYNPEKFEIFQRVFEVSIAVSDACKCVYSFVMKDIAEVIELLKSANNETI